MVDATETSRNTAASSSSHAARVISLVGFMGAGKTTVGRLLASRLGWRFLDLDDLIQAHDGRTIQQIFQESGEATFRNLEHDLLKNTVRNPPERTVLSLGGGAFVDNTNQELLRENGIPAVFLDAPADELFRRCAEPGVLRPLLRDQKRFCDLYAQRRPAYMKAVFHIQTAGKKIETIVEEIMGKVGFGRGSGVSQ